MKEVMRYLDLEVRKSLVGFGHTVRIFFLLEGAAFTLSCCDDLVGQLVGNGFTIALAGETDEPLHAQGYFTIGANLSRYLEGSATYTTATHFYSRGNVYEGAFPHFVAVFAGYFRYFI